MGKPCAISKEIRTPKRWKDNHVQQATAGDLAVRLRDHHGGLLPLPDPDGGILRARRVGPGLRPHRRSRLHRHQPRETPRNGQEWRKEVQQAVEFHALDDPPDDAHGVVLDLVLRLRQPRPSVLPERNHPRRDERATRALLGPRSGLVLDDRRQLPATRSPQPHLRRPDLLDLRHHPGALLRLEPCEAPLPVPQLAQRAAEGQGQDDQDARRELEGEARRRVG